MKKIISFAAVFTFSASLFAAPDVTMQERDIRNQANQHPVVSVHPEAERQNERIEDQASRIERESDRARGEAMNRNSQMRNDPNMHRNPNMNHSPEANRNPDVNRHSGINRNHEPNRNLEMHRNNRPGIPSEPHNQPQTPPESMPKPL